MTEGSAFAGRVQGRRATTSVPRVAPRVSSTSRTPASAAPSFEPPATDDEVQAAALQYVRKIAGTTKPSAANQAAFDRALDLAERLDDPVLAGVADPQRRLKVEILQQAVNSAKIAVETEIGPALGVSAGFNAQDGD